MADSELPRNHADAVRAEHAGTRMTFLLFWGHQPPRDGGVGASCLSQWWPAPFDVKEHTFRTAEHYMMAHKAWLFGDDAIARRVLDARTPGEAKKLGRRVRGFDEETWAARRYDVVVSGNTAKFGQHPELGDYLLGTGGRVLVEASPVDRVWGIGLAAVDERARRPSAWRGRNLLGFALMDVRDVLAARR